MPNSIAHTKKDHFGNWQTHSLKQHLTKVAALAQQFAGTRGGLFVRYAGLLHDLGKFQAAFQVYIRNVTGFECENAHLEDPERPHAHKISHSTAGAKYAVSQNSEELYPFFAHLLAYLIAGHHAGLADWYDKGSLKHRLQNADKELADSLAGVAQNSVEDVLIAFDNQKLTDELHAFFTNGLNAEELHIWIRFLFSCLVDADFLDTEAFMNGYANADEAKQAGFRPTFPALSELYNRYESYMQQLAERTQDSPLNQERNAILKQCFQAAELDKSLLGLTVPTGGGKTLASLGFALKHALKHHKKRIIYTIPFTSIIEQNANVFRKVLGDDVVLEHHSNLDVAEKDETAKSRLATENWDGPLIVTTNVQFFESLFSARTSRCRKIHNIADSIVILDEAQHIPRDFQKPITDVMRVLARDYGVTFVLCTATPPELGKTVDEFDRTLLEGLPAVHEIISDKVALAERLRRVIIRMPNGQTRHRETVRFTAELRQTTLNTITAVRELLESGKTPAPEYGKHCKACSLMEICQPELLGKRDRSVGYVVGVVLGNISS